MSSGEVCYYTRSYYDPYQQILGMNPGAMGDRHYEGRYRREGARIHLDNGSFIDITDERPTSEAPVLVPIPQTSAVLLLLTDFPKP